MTVRGHQPSLPKPVAPMLAVLGEPKGGSGQAIEFKWDGIRCTAYTGGGEVRLLSRNGRDITMAYPEVVCALADSFGRRRSVLDGELVALDAAAGNRPSFSRLQQRVQLAQPRHDLIIRVPVSYYVFDLLVLDERLTAQLPYRQRRELLGQLGLVGEPLRVPPYFPDADPQEMIVAAQAQGIEGIVIKRMDSTYQPGCRSLDWIKVPFNLTQEVVIIGYKPGQGRRAETVGSLLLAVAAPDGRLSFAGGVGTGFTDKMLDLLRDRLAPLIRATASLDGVPREFARGVFWVEPVLVGEVSYRSFSDDHRLRHASWRGLRPEKFPRETRPVSGPAETVELTMSSRDGAWLIEVIRVGSVTFYRITHGDDVVDRIADVEQVKALLERARVRLADLDVVPGIGQLQPPDTATASRHTSRRTVAG